MRQPRDAQEFDDQLALHIQRTTDLFERQARQLAIRHVLAALPALSQSSRAGLQTTLPLSAKLFALDQAFEVSAVLSERCDDHNDLTALACVAAARLFDFSMPAQAAPATTSELPS